MLIHVIGSTIIADQCKAINVPHQGRKKGIVGETIAFSWKKSDKTKIETDFFASYNHNNNSLMQKIDKVI